ncbi:hypothetical protein OB920_13205 [Halobacteria archaeon HArc-gm2]|nr:hypothetical protein [Halobacteria archaeon HArc-gm2]
MASSLLATLFDVVFLLIASAIFGLLAYGVFKLANRHMEINPKRELLLVVVGGILGSLAFTIISPFVVPPIQSAQADLRAPNPDMSIEYTEDIPEDYYRVYDIPRNGSGYVFYRVEIANPSNYVLQSFDVSLAFNGCVDDVGLDYLDRPTASALGIRDTLVMQQDFPESEIRRCTRNFHVKNLEPQQVVSLYYLVDTTPEEEVTVRTSGAPSSNGTVLIGHRYYWNFRGQLDAEGHDPQYRNASEISS